MKFPVVYGTFPGYSHLSQLSAIAKWPTLLFGTLNHSCQALYLLAIRLLGAGLMMPTPPLLVLVRSLK